jgi:hypothetical protein
LSEYQYYEFQAIDRPLSEADRSALRSLSTRARITATSFTNHYEWGNFKGDPEKLMERWFDLHLYLANWGTRRLMIRLPKRLVDRSRLDAFLRGGDLVDILVSGDNLIVDMCIEIYDDKSSGYDEWEEWGDWDDGAGWLGALAPLRADVLSGDLRLFYLLWLKALERGELEDDETEPLPGIGPLTGALEAFAEFFRIDPDLLQSAVEASGSEDGGEFSTDASRKVIAASPETEKTALLQHLADGDPHVAAEVRSRVRKAVTLASGETYTERRIVADLRSRAAERRAAREAIEAERREAERQRQAREAEEARRLRLDAVRRRGTEVWIEVEKAISKRNPDGYEQAISLLLDLQALAGEDGETETFTSHVRSLRERHARKPRFIERLAQMDGPWVTTNRYEQALLRQI